MVHCSRRRSLGTLLALAVLIALTALLVFLGQARADEPSPSSSPTVVRLEKRAEYSNTYLLSDGQYRCVTYQSPVNYQAPDGSWQPIDTSLLPDGGLDLYSTTATPVEVTVADEAPGQKPVSVSDGDWTVTMQLVGWAEDEKLVVDDVALYTDVAPATDVAYTVMGDGIKEVITLASPAAPNTFTYRLTHAGLELRQDADGGWGLYEPGASEPVFVVGNMTTCDSSLDAADEPAWCEGARMTVTPGENASTISYFLPREWMNDPARVYPLKIDPNLGSGDTLDTYLSAGLPTQSFGSEEDLLCGRMNSSADKCRTLVQFPQVGVLGTGDIPRGADITAAAFRLRQYWQPATHSDSVYVSRLTADAWWTENSTYSGANGRMDTNYDWPVETVSGTGVWMAVSCGTVTEEWFRFGGNNGFIVYEPDASGSGYSRKFRSSEYTGTDYDPNLNVDYTPDSGKPITVDANHVLQASGTTGWRNTSQSVTLTAADPDNGTCPGAGVADTYYKVDGGSQTTYAGAFTVSGAGQHVVEYWSVDAAPSPGPNTEIHKTGYVNIDTAAPVTTPTGLQANNNSGWRTTSQSVSLTAADTGGSGVANIKYRIDGGTLVTVSGSSAFFTVSGAGQHTVTYYATDVATNVETTKTGYVNIETTAPVTTPTGLQSTSTSGWRNASQNVTLTATDASPGSGVANIRYRIDGGTLVTVSGSAASFTVSGAGQHTVTYYATDVATNVETTKTGYVNIDTAAPVTTATGLQATSNSGWRTTSQSVSLSATDSGGSGVANIYYKLDGGAQATYATAFNVSGVGQHTVEYLAVDTAGNPEAHRTGWVNIYNGTPTATSPNTAVSWLRGSVQTVTWTVPQSLAIVGGHFHVAAVESGGAAHAIADDVAVTSSTSYSVPWTVLEAAASGWKVRVIYDSAAGSEVARDSSDVGFTIAECAPVVTSPNGGEACYVGRTESITWTAPAVSYGRFSVALVNGGAVTTLSSNVAATGATSYSFPWTVAHAAANGWQARVTYFNAAGTQIALDNSNADFAILPDNEVQHTTTDLGSWDGHDLGCRLDDGKLTASVTDLAIASLGPAAEVSRSYRTGAATTRHAPGWFFSFDQHLDLSHVGDALSKVIYTDADNVAHDFYRPTGSSAWLAPNGLVATLSQNPDGSWKLLFDQSQDYLTFSSSGQLLSETAANGLATSYAWSANSLTITAANGQQIAVAFSSGAVSGASYATSAGTRTVAYAGSGSAWSATYNAADTGANGTARTVAYAYGSGLLTGVTQQAWPESGSSATLAILYDAGSKVTEVRYPGYDGATRPDARATISYDTSTRATVGRYGTVAGVANQPMGQSTYTWTASSAEVPNQTTSVTEGSGSAAAVTTYEYADDLQVESATTTSGSDTVALSEAEVDGDVLGGRHDVTAEATATEIGSNGVSDAQHTDYLYDAQHRVIRETTYRSYNPATGEGTQPTTRLYAYDIYGNITDEQVFDGTEAGTRISWTHKAYDAGRLTCEKHWVSGSTLAETQYSDFAPNGEPQTTVAKDVELSYGGAAQDLTKTASYDTFGNLLTETDWGGRTTQASTYDLAGRVLTSNDAAGVVTHTAYDPLGNATETYRTASGTSMKAAWRVTAYDGMGRALTVTTKLSDGTGTPSVQSVVTNVYDGSGQQLTSSDSTVGGEDEKWLYDEQGNVTRHWAMGVAADDEARATRTAYDAQGQVTGESQPGNSAAPGASGSNLTGYDAAAQVTSEAKADGSFTTYSYDDEGNQTTAESSVTGTLASTYGADGRLASQTNESGFTTSSAYDGLGRATGATGSGQPETQTTYNHLGWVLRTTDANGVTTQKTYDAHGAVTDETVGSAGTTHSTYDDAGRLLTRTDPNGNLLTGSYDAFGNLHEEEHRDWNSAVLKDVVTDHDSLGRPTSQSESVSGRSRTWTYPENTEGGVEETLSYDAAPLTGTTVARNARGAETSRETSVASGVTLTRSVADTSGRDQADRWTSASLQLTGYGALTLGRSFDNAGRMATQSGAGFTSPGSYSYNATSGLKSNQTLPLELGGVINESYTYHSDGRLQTWGSATYAYDAAGNLTGDGSTTFAYSTSGTPNRLVSSTTGGLTTVYGWDQANAWRTSQGPAGTPDQIQYTYVKSGATTSNGRMTRFQSSATSTDASYAYDAFGQRTKSAATFSGTTTTTTYTYDGLTLLKLSAAQGSASWRIDYLYDEEGVLYGGVYRSPATSTSPTPFSVIANDHGDVLELLDANGGAFASYRYDPWGAPLASGTTTASTSLISSSLAVEIAARQVLRYASYAYDGESGLYYCSARYYDPLTRQWTTGDPVTADGEESAYQYCRCDPVGNEDPTGASRRRIQFPAPGDKMAGWESYLKAVLLWDAGHAAQRLADELSEHITSQGPIIGVAEAIRQTWWWWGWDMVRGEHHWDLKLRAPKAYRTKRYIPFEGKKISPEDFGNIHFAYTGMAIGIPAGVLTSGSGAASLNGGGWFPSDLWNEFHDEVRIAWGCSLYVKWHGQASTAGNVWFSWKKK